MESNLSLRQGYVRANIAQLVGGACEETITCRVRGRIVTSNAGSESFKSVLKIQIKFSSLFCKEDWMQ